MFEAIPQRLLLGLWALCLFFVTLGLNTRHNNFPYFYHPDEPGKVEQVMKGNWNFHHPMLLLSACQVAVKVAQVPQKEQSIVEAGRLVSAAYTAAAVVALSLLAWLWRGWPCALIAGGALALHHQLYELSHYMKEDTALLLGMSAAFLALLAFEQTPNPLRAAFLGAGCALAVSGKYLGIIAVFCAIPILWRGPSNARWKFFAAFFASFLVLLTIVNLPLLLDLGRFKQSLARETEFVVEGQKGMTRSVPHAQYWNVFIDNTTPALWLFLAIFLRARWRNRQKITPAQWIIIGFPFVYALALSFSPKSNDRYFLPATAIFTLLASLGVLDAARALGERLRQRVTLSIAGALILLGQLPSWIRYERAFQHDDTAELIEWLKKEVPPNAVIAKDNRIGLPDPKKKKHQARIGVIPQEVRAAQFAADLGSIEELKQQGVTHLAVSESDYGKFFLKNLRPKESSEADFVRRKAFYDRLLHEEDNLLFERERGTVIYLHPGIRVYRIANVK